MIIFWACERPRHRPHFALPRAHQENTGGAAEYRTRRAFFCAGLLSTIALPASRMNPCLPCCKARACDRTRLTSTKTPPRICMIFHCGWTLVPPDCERALASPRREGCLCRHLSIPSRWRLRIPIRRQSHPPQNWRTSVHGHDHR